jgi:arylsulfatase A-like enzyme
MDVHEYAAPPEFQRFGADDRGAYLAAVHWVDDAIRRVRLELERRRLAESTLLVLAADHGETFGEHGVHGHARNVLTPVVHVPLLLRLPFPIEPLRITAQVRNLDVAPTLLDLLGLPVPPSFEGESLLAVLAGEAPEADRPAFAELGVPLFPDASVQAALCDGRWTYARNAPADGGGEEFAKRGVDPGAELLFDRSVDPAENVNLVRREGAEAARLRAALDAYLARAPAGVAKPGVRIDPAIAEKLRAMGYLR